MNKNTAVAIQFADAEDENMKQINKRKAEKFAAKYNSARLPKKKVKVVKLMSCKTCRKAQGVCKYIGKTIVYLQHWQVAQFSTMDTDFVA